ncbi:MAG: Ada metal-binding domain-containing protein [Bacteroidota bacterium]
MYPHNELSGALFNQLIKSGQVQIAGNQKLKIYGRLSCKSGKRIKVVNRVFFISVKEAESYGYRPCGHCMIQEYRKWKDEFV